MKKLIGMFVSALFTVAAADSVFAQDYKKEEKKYYKHDFDKRDYYHRDYYDRVYYEKHPHHNTWGYQRIDVINPRPYYGYQHTWDGRTILIDGRKYQLDEHGRYLYNDHYYYYKK